MSTAYATRPKANSLVTILLMVWGLLKFILFPLLALFVMMEISTPSLSFSARSATVTYTSDLPHQWVDRRSASGQIWPALHTTLLTHDYRHLKVDYFAPQQMVNNAPIPLTIIVTGFMTPEWLIDQVRPRGFNAIVIYRSPRADRINGPNWPTRQQFRDARRPGDYWNLLSTNPLNRIYSLHAGLHESPEDVVDIITWAKKNMRGDGNRINLVGMGSGALIAAAAAHKLEAIGTPARTLTLIYPPALLSEAVRDNLLDTPRWLRPLAGHGLSLLYFRLDLQRHLPRLSERTAKLLVIPRNSFDLATYAAVPAIPMAGAKTTVEYVDAGFQGFYTPSITEKIRQLTGNWLVTQGGISTY